MLAWDITRRVEQFESMLVNLSLGGSVVAVALHGATVKMRRVAGARRERESDRGYGKCKVCIARPRGRGELAAERHLGLGTLSLENRHYG